MLLRSQRLLLAVVLAVPAAAVTNPATCRGEEYDVPRLKFFYFAGDNVDWVVSSDKKNFAAHLRTNSDSHALVSSLHEAVRREHQIEEARTRMTEWLGGQRELFRQRGTNPTAARESEGIVAYLRAHDFGIENLVRALKARSGAQVVELVAIHQVDPAGESRYRLKVVLDDAIIDRDQMGYNVVLSSAAADYTSVVYALAHALYDVQEADQRGPAYRRAARTGRNRRRQTAGRNRSGHQRFRVAVRSRTPIIDWALAQGKSLGQIIPQALSYRLAVSTRR